MRLRIERLGKITQAEQLYRYVAKLREILRDQFLTIPNAVILTGTLSAASGGIVHGITDLEQRIVLAYGFRSSTGTAIPMTISSITNTNINYTGAAVNDKYRILLLIQDKEDTNWP